MKEFDYSKYDKDSADQLRFIHLKETIENLEKEVGQFKLTCASLEGTVKKFLGILEDRVKVLEESRQRQIALNSTFAQKGITEAKTEAKAEIKISKPKGFWDIFK